MEVFPIEIVLRGEAIWLGWVSPEDGDEIFLTDKGYLIFSCDGKDGLAREVVNIFPAAHMKGESFFDLDAVAGRLDGRFVLEDDFALNLWNLLTDLYHTFGGEDRMFYESRRDVYSRIFSQSEVAPLVGVKKGQISARDIEVVREVLLAGIEFLVQKMRDAKESRSH